MASSAEINESESALLLQELEDGVESKKFNPSRHKLSCKLITVLIITIIIIILIVYILYAIPFQSSVNNYDYSNTLGDGSHDLTGEYYTAAAVSNAPPCADVARDVLKDGGKAVDAMIAGMLCDGVTMPQSMGIGGGFFMLIYKRSEKKVYAINAREAAPGASSINMFHENFTLSHTGPLSIAVPGEIKGYQVAYDKFGGGVSWKRLFEPTIGLCENGIPIGHKLGENIKRKEKMIRSNPEFRLLFVNPDDDTLLQAGQKYKNLKLANTLRIISKEGGNSFYKGSISKALVNDIQSTGGIITADDLARYEAHIEEPIEAPLFNNLTLYSTTPPSSGAILGYILRIVNGLLPAPSELLNTQRTTEALKYAYGARTRMGDPRYYNITKVMSLITSEDFIDQIRRSISDTETSDDPNHYGGDFVAPKDKGTANLAVIAENGDAVVATSTVNYLFGSSIISNSTGIILNDQMDDFSSPSIINYFGISPSKANFIEPYKRPLSSMNPSLVIDRNGDVKLAIGASGGSRITSAVALAIIRNLAMNETIRESIDKVFFHHQLQPMVWLYHPQISQDIIDGMKDIGHDVQPEDPSYYAIVSAIEKRNNKLLACTSYLRPGQVNGY